MNCSLAHRLVVAAALAGLSLPALAGVIVVSQTPGPQVDFTSIQPAVNAAVDGDVLLIAAGNYEPLLQLGDKSLVLQVVPGALETFRVNRLVVSDLSAGKSLLVRGLQVLAAVDLEFFDVSSCEGALLFEDCVFNGASNPGHQVRIPKVEDSTHVVFTRCVLQGATSPMQSPGGVTPPTGGPGLVVDGASVTLYDCTVRGGNGANAGFYQDFLPLFSSAAGQALQVYAGSTLNLIGCDVRGGEGGDGAKQLPSMGFLCLAPSVGGAGLRTYSLVRRLDTSLVGGAGGAGPECAPTDATSGKDTVLLPGGSVLSIPQLARSLEISSPIEDGGPVSLAIEGQPGELCALLQSLTPSGTWLNGFKGTLAGAPPYTLLVLGPLGPDGKLAFTIPLPAGLLPAGTDSLTIVNQLNLAATGGGGLLSSPTQITLVHDVP